MALSTLSNQTASRWWCFTWQVPDGLSWEESQAVVAAIYRKERVLAVVANPEEAPITGQMHWQAVIRLDSPRKFAYVKKILPEGCHIEKTRWAGADCDMTTMNYFKEE